MWVRRSSRWGPGCGATPRVHRFGSPVQLRPLAHAVLGARGRNGRHPGSGWILGLSPGGAPVHRAGFRHVKLSPTYTREEVEAALDEASTLGMSVTVHGGGVSDTTPTSMTRMAVEAGAPCIEHLNQMDEEVLDLIAERGVHVVPTLAIYRALYEGDFIPRPMIEERNW